MKIFHTAVWASIFLCIFFATAVNADDTATSGTSTGTTSGAAGGTSTVTNFSAPPEARPGPEEMCIGTLISINSCETVYYSMEGNLKYGSFADLQNTGYIHPSYTLSTITPEYSLVFLLPEDAASYAIIAAPSDFNKRFYFTWQPNWPVVVGGSESIPPSNESGVFKLKETGYHSGMGKEFAISPENSQIGSLGYLFLNEMIYRGIDDHKVFGTIGELQTEELICTKEICREDFLGTYIPDFKLTFILSADKSGYAFIAVPKDKNIHNFMTFSTIVPEAEGPHVTMGENSGPMSIDMYMRISNQSGYVYELEPVEMPIHQ